MANAIVPARLRSGEFGGGGGGARARASRSVHEFD